MRRPLVLAALAVLAAGTLLGGLILAGQYLRGQLKDDPRYLFPVADIDCPAPPGLTRQDFLGEVRYLAELPHHVSLMDDEMPARLQEALARHAWVENARVEVGPGRNIHAKLTFRTPVLAAMFVDREQVTRAVDGRGILLPRGCNVQGLPRLRGVAAPPANGPGRPWGEPHVEGAAKLAGWLHPHRDQLAFSAFEWGFGELRLHRDELPAAPMVLWGHPPGEEIEGEASAKQKLQRLLDYCQKHGGLNRLDPQTILDLRTVKE